MRKIAVFLSLVLLLLLTLPAQAATYTASNATELINALNTVVAGDVIEITANISLTAVDNINFSGSNGLPAISINGLTINANGFAIIRPNTVAPFRLFQIDTGGAVTFNNITLSGGTTTFEGGNVYVYNSSAVFNESRIQNGSADFGGGIGLRNSSLILNDSTVINNTATTGGGIDSYLSSAEVNNSTIIRNEATWGGGINNEDSIGLLEINDSTIRNNIADFGGGVFNNRASIAISNSLFLRNRAYCCGGGLHTLWGDANISNTEFRNNHADDNGGGLYAESTDVEIINSKFLENRSLNDGAGIYTSFDVMTIRNSTIADNISDDDGGGIYNFDNDLTIENSTISGNVADDDGGGIDNLGVAEVINSTISRNIAGDDGGGIDNNDGLPITINNSTIFGNRAGYGGGIYNDIASFVFLTNSIVIQNRATIGEDECENIGATFSTANNNLLGLDGTGDGCPVGASDLAPYTPAGTILSALADNGGPTQTHALVIGSLAINGSGGGATGNDQRGAISVLTRDIGAYEFDGVLPTLTMTVDELVLTEGGIIIQASVTLTTINFVAPFDVEIGFSGVASSSDYTSNYAGPYTINGNGDISFTVDIIDDSLAENPEPLILNVLIQDLIQIINPRERITLISDEVPPAVPITVATTSDTSIAVFDPAISKIGFLTPGQVGVTGEELEWIVTVSNTGNVIGQNVTVTDTLVDALQIDSVDAPGANVTINGQTVTVVYPVLNIGETVQFSIFTTVLDGVSITNTACVNADNQGEEECATGLSVSQLPNTGEVPFWQNWIVWATSILLIAASFLLLRIRKAA